MVNFFFLHQCNQLVYCQRYKRSSPTDLYRFCFGFYRQPSPAIYNTGQAEPGLETCICAILALPVTDTDLAMGEGRKSVVLGVEKLLPTQGCIIEHLLDFEWADQRN